jgi:hypothetical protein
MAFDRNQEEEALLIIKKGIVTKVIYFHNRIVQGNSMQDFGKAIVHETPLSLLPVA